MGCNKQEQKCGKNFQNKPLQSIYCKNLKKGKHGDGEIKGVRGGDREREEQKGENT